MTMQSLRSSERNGLTRDSSMRSFISRAYADQSIPGAPSEENQELARKAVEQFRGVLEIDPQNISALDGVGAILYQMAIEA